MGPNVRLWPKLLTVTNTLAYCITKKLYNENFIVEAPSDEGCKKLEKATSFEERVVMLFAIHSEIIRGDTKDMIRKLYDHSFEFEYCIICDTT